MADWTLDPSDGELQLRTGVRGRAARMGHRLTIAMTRWRATVTWSGRDPATAELSVETDSLEVLRGEGGVKGLSGPEKTVIRSNAMKSLDAARFPRIRFLANVVEKSVTGYRLTGELEIRGMAREHVIDLRAEDLGDSWRMSAESTVRQSDYGIKPYSLLMGSLQVADDVTVSFTAVHAKND
ncbi:YceI family protein [Mycobacterium parmense]|uniref:Polyisoprenoid-binding protein n=1 Tax=Mycobacterium parmense TaxID=185642 RepID=A0A7I7YQK7_9MYCO|nr:YceI family protein [Mycobacterium parmense]MCV7353399.1 YceI family protein [Mycobacterium parmense]ORW51594.1 S-adenosyl-L-methionine-dependent methyltransferase [Mycobacterium parmense]BBZ44040.1 polyisoprenoid-binding protein [Mycobacterium parmense]